MDIVKVSNIAEQTQNVIGVLNKFNKENYLLMLSGGQPPNGLYKYLSHSFNYTFPSDMALTDEMWQRQKFHKDSNELIIKNTGLLGRVEWEKTNWHPILTEMTTPKEEALRYDAELRSLFLKYGKNTAAILSMGVDGHIAGVLPYSNAISSQDLALYYEGDDEYGVHITTTLKCIQDNFHTVILLIDNRDKFELFEKIINQEADTAKYPVLVLKTCSDVTVLAIDQD